MSAQPAQSGAEQGDGEERKGDVEKTTSTAPRSQQRSNAPESTASVTGSASEQGSAVRGLVNLYEIAVLYHPDLEIDLEKASGKVEKIITDAGGKITKTDNWGKRKLAYTIAKQEFAVYVFYSVEMPSDAAGKIEQAFNITDEIIRFMITRPDLKAMAKAEAMRAEKAAKAAVNPDVPGKDENEDRESGPRPERRGKAAQRADSPADEDDSADDAGALTKEEKE